MRSTRSLGRGSALGRRAALVLLLGVVSLPARGASSAAPARDPAVTGSALASAPQIALTSIPAYGSSAPLQGTVSGVTAGGFAVAVYTHVPAAGWSNRPTAAAPLTTIDAKGTWTCNIVADGIGPYAIEIVAFLVPAGYQPPVVNLAQVLPAALYGYPHAEAIRYPRLQFANCEWLIKRVHDLVCPGPNYFSDNAENVWLDTSGRLHLKMTQRSGQWYCAEVLFGTPLGHGRYALTVAGGLKGMDRNAVLDFFTWDDFKPDRNYSEMDVEFSRWGDAKIPNARFMVQPWHNPGNMHQFELDPSHDPNGVTTHEIVWDAGQATFRSYYGAFTLHPPAGRLIASWTCKGAHVPAEGQENFHLSLWLLAHLPPSDGRPVEVTISNAVYLPADLSPVYRFSAPGTPAYFYTISEAQKAKVLRDYPKAWTYDGVVFWALAQACHWGLAPVYRFWSGPLADHVYTMDEAEKSALLAQSAGLWTYEGVAFYAWPDGGQPPGTCPVYRFRATTTGNHFYTARAAEKNQLLQDPSHRWIYEGIAWHAYSLPSN